MPAGVKRERGENDKNITSRSADEQNEQNYLGGAKKRNVIHRYGIDRV